MKKTDKSEIRKVLVKNKLPVSAIRYLEDIFDVFTQRSAKLPEDYKWPDYMNRLVGQQKRSMAIHLYGHPTSGKSAILTNLVNSLPDGVLTLWIDTTFTFTPGLIKNKDRVFVFPSSHIKPILDTVGQYGVVILDDFAGLLDSPLISTLISKCKQNGTYLFIANQIRQWGKVPRAMKAKVMVLCDITINTQRAENKTNSAYYQLSTEHHRPTPSHIGKYVMLEISKQGVVHEKQSGTGGPMGSRDLLLPECPSNTKEQVSTDKE